MSIELLGRSVLSDVGASDAFGRLRVSNPVTLFDSQSQYDAAPLLWTTKTVGSATEAHVANDSSVDIAVTTASGDRFIRQSRQYHRYQPGKSQLVLVTGVFGTGQANTEKKVGYFDDANGVFLKEENGALSVVLRSSSSGSVVDDEIPEASWSGSVPGLDSTKAFIFWVDLEWLGVGRVRCGFNIDGKYYLANEWLNANSVSTTYMTTANLPVRYEIENTGTAAGASTLKCICCSVISEGGFEDDRGRPFVASNGTTTISVNARRPVLSIRPKATFNSITNRGQIVVDSTELFADDYPTYVEVVRGGTLTGASFTSADSSSITEYDVSATAISGGIVVDAYYVAAGKSVKGTTNASSLLSKLPLTLDVDGANPIALTVVATTVPNNSSDTGAVIKWREFR